ncbi:hypothetical protein [Nonlabens xiamenensis]|uniref:hypothetical protein n=1 Tax=Nonlabens xiamenensis TaxID=2341043 RepID=UPI000F606974|nr:hypothetical protein [Nonlabens xiamenensis]
MNKNLLNKLFSQRNVLKSSSPPVFSVHFTGVIYIGAMLIYIFHDFLNLDQLTVVLWMVMFYFVRWCILKVLQNEYRKYGFAEPKGSPVDQLDLSLITTRNWFLQLILILGGFLIIAIALTMIVSLEDVFSFLVGVGLLLIGLQVMCDGWSKDIITRQIVVVYPERLVFQKKDSEDVHVFYKDLREIKIGAEYLGFFPKQGKMERLEPWKFSDQAQRKLASRLMKHNDEIKVSRYQ